MVLHGMFGHVSRGRGVLRTDKDVHFQRCLLLSFDDGQEVKLSPPLPMMFQCRPALRFAFVTYTSTLDLFSLDLERDSLSLPF